MHNKVAIVLLFGGVGNRLFQISRAIDLKKSGFKPLVVELENFWLLNFFARNIMGWIKHPLWIDFSTLCSSLQLELSLPTLKIRWDIYLYLLKFFGKDRRPLLHASANACSSRVQIGYFQGEDVISMDSLTLVADEVYQQVRWACKNKVGALLHIRGGDFKFEDRLKGDQVNEFIEFVNGDFECITNDPVYAKSLYNKMPIGSSLGPRDDFSKLCHANIIYPSNSTFCFWGCLIAVKRNGAKLWTRPKEDYWRLLQADWIK